MVLTDQPRREVKFLKEDLRWRVGYGSALSMWISCDATEHDDRISGRKKEDTPSTYIFNESGRMSGRGIIGGIVADGRV